MNAPSPARIAEIRLNRSRMLLRLSGLWAQALHRAPTPRSRSKYDPAAEDRKHALQALQ